MASIIIVVRGNVHHQSAHLRVCAIEIGESALLFSNLKLFFLGSPSAPLSPSFTPQSLSSVLLSWTPSDADCVVKYTIILTNITEGNAS